MPGWCCLVARDAWRPAQERGSCAGRHGQGAKAATSSRNLVFWVRCGLGGRGGRSFLWRVGRRGSLVNGASRGSRGRLGRGVGARGGRHRGRLPIVGLNCTRVRRIADAVLIGDAAVWHRSGIGLRLATGGCRGSRVSPRCVAVTTVTVAMSLMAAAIATAMSPAGLDRAVLGNRAVLHEQCGQSGDCDAPNCSDHDHPLKDVRRKFPSAGPMTCPDPARCHQRGTGEAKAPRMPTA